MKCLFALLCCLWVCSSFSQPPMPGASRPAARKLSLHEAVHAQIAALLSRHPSTNVMFLKQVTVRFMAPPMLAPHYKTCLLVASTNSPLGPFNMTLATYPNDYTTHDTVVAITNRTKMFFRAVNLYIP